MGPGVRRDDIEFLARSSKISVNPIFTTFMRARFTKAFDVIARNRLRPCVWRARIAD